MPGGAHLPAGARRPRAERGFSLIEIIIVMILVAIALLAAIHTITSVRRSSVDSKYVASAGVVWRGVGAYRQDHKGALPPISAFDDRGAGLANPAGTPYVRSWPDDPATGELLLPTQGSQSPPAEPGPKNTVQYWASANGEAGRLVAYGSDGRIVFLRSVTGAAQPEVPVG